MAGVMKKRTQKIPTSKGKKAKGFYAPQKDHPKQPMPPNKKTRKK